VDGPEYNKNDKPMQLGPDKHSFPSGHCTRMVQLTLVIFKLTNDLTWRYAMVGWCVAIGVSRVMLGRHFVGDVLAGTFIVPWVAMWVQTRWFWLEPNACAEHHATLYAATGFRDHHLDGIVSRL